jgi:hypothetical protein
VRRYLLGLLIYAAACPPAQAQQAPPAQPQPQVKVRMINVCTPPADEQKEIASALSRVPKQPLFGTDFEVDRGRSSLDEAPNFLQAGGAAKMVSGSEVATWIRIRREFAVQALFSRVQYSFSVDPKNMLETLVLQVRDPKDLMQLSIEDSASNVTTPEAMLSQNTPATHIRLERFGKSSIALARCSATDAGPAPDQSAYEPLFQSASAILANYRHLLNTRVLVPEELRRTGITTGHKIPVKGGPRTPPQPQK